MTVAADVRIDYSTLQCRHVIKVLKDDVRSIGGWEKFTEVCRKYGLEDRIMANIAGFDQCLILLESPMGNVYLVKFGSSCEVIGLTPEGVGLCEPCAVNSYDLWSAICDLLDICEWAAPPRASRHSVGSNAKRHSRT